MRIVDNLLSNILKYADQTEPVRMFYFLNQGSVILHVENSIQQNADHSDGTNIGIISAERLASEMGGNLLSQVSDGNYIVVLTLPIVDNQN